MTFDDIFKAAEFFSREKLIESKAHYIENLASWGIAVEPATETLFQFDFKELVFHEISGLSNCLELVTTRNPKVDQVDSTVTAALSASMAMPAPVPEFIPAPEAALLRRTCRP